MNQSELMSKNHKKVSNALNYTEHMLVLTFAATGCVSNPAFASFVVIPIRIMSSTVGWKIFAMAAGIKGCSP